MTVTSGRATAGAERERLARSREGSERWKHWGPYLSLRQWGTVREDYSPDGDAWTYLPHDHARSRAYRWGEDGLGGISDRWQHLCFAVALWNGKDPILKERLFGLTNSEGNHGEDVKEHWWPLDCTPTHSWMRWLYRYPQAAFPYDELLQGNAQRGRDEPEFELVDTGVLDGGRYTDVEVTYAKAAPDDLCIQIRCTNRGPDPAVLHLLPTAWFRNTWAWGRDRRHPQMSAFDDRTVRLEHTTLGERWLRCSDEPTLLFTDNETNAERLFGTASRTAYVKDGIGDHVVRGLDTVNPARTGTKVSPWYLFTLAPGETREVRLRLSDAEPAPDALTTDFERVLAQRSREADEFFQGAVPEERGAEEIRVHRLAIAGLLWTKQYYGFRVDQWQDGDPAGPAPAPGRVLVRNTDWRHLANSDIISMPDGWEYPWYAAWDLAFHMIPMASVDPDFAKDQLVLLCREWYMHPNGQLPAYEWAFDDTNPPVHAWAAYRVFKIDEKLTGVKDYAFLERIFHKLVINFTWWVNKKDIAGRNVFAGGFLGLDNIGLFDRSKPLPGGGQLEQADGTSWMAMYALNMLAIALELAAHDDVYEDVATKFFEHFLGIARALNTLDLWDEEDGFFYDVLRTGGSGTRLKVRSAVGLIPLFAVQSVPATLLDHLPDFAARVQWLRRHRPELCENLFTTVDEDGEERHMLAVIGPDRLDRVLAYLLDEVEFLSPHGIRSLSRHHLQHPLEIELAGEIHRIDYEPAESRTAL
nr:glucosidase [Actinomycetota bacterium]